MTSYNLSAAEGDACEDLLAQWTAEALVKRPADEYRRLSSLGRALGYRIARVEPDSISVSIAGSGVELVRVPVATLVEAARVVAKRPAS